MNKSRIVEYSNQNQNRSEYTMITGIWKCHDPLTWARITMAKKPRAHMLRLCVSFISTNNTFRAVISATDFLHIFIIFGGQCFYYNRYHMYMTMKSHKLWATKRKNYVKTNWTLLLGTLEKFLMWTIEATDQTDRRTHWWMWQRIRRAFSCLIHKREHPSI